jgi:hypothetical protein
MLANDQPVEVGFGWFVKDVGDREVAIHQARLARKREGEGRLSAAKRGEVIESVIH